jgi:hypothetical protein
MPVYYFDIKEPQTLAFSPPIHPSTLILAQTTLLARGARSSLPSISVQASLSEDHVWFEDRWMVDS